MRYMQVYFIIWNDGTRETFTSRSDRSCRAYALENQGYDRDIDFQYDSDLIPEDDLYC